MPKKYSGFNRREALTSFVTIAVTGLAGCNTGVLTGSDPEESTPPSTEEESETRTDTQTEVTDTSSNTDRPGSASLSVDQSEIKLPAIWQDHSIENFTPSFTASVKDPDGVKKVKLLNSSGETVREFKPWTGEKTFELSPSLLEPGENQFQLTAEDSQGNTFSASTTVNKKIPDMFRVDIVPEKNQELRKKITEMEGKAFKGLKDRDPKLYEHTKNELENYLEKHGGFVTDSTIFKQYSSHEDLEFDKIGIDLAAAEWFHDNDYVWTGSARSEETIKFIDSVGHPEKYPELTRPEQSQYIYPNGESGKNPGHFSLEKFANAPDAGTALNWLHPYLLHFQSEAPGPGPTSSEDHIYAAVIQQAFDMYTDLDVHAWPVKTGFGGHGNGLIYDKDNDELRVLEVGKFRTTKFSGFIPDVPDWQEQLHPLIENSHFLAMENPHYPENPDHPLFTNPDGDIDGWYHPLQFGHKDYDKPEQGFTAQKWEATRMFGAMNGTVEDWDDTYMHIAPTTEYIQSVVDTFRNYNDNSFDFQELYNQSKVLHHLNLTNHNFVIHGTVENPKYTKLPDDLKAPPPQITTYPEKFDNLIAEIWKDQEGKYDDFDQYVAEEAG